jgi:uncharacterized short protein YbdD (DUF466 family)
MAKIRQILIELWSFARELLGENAYARYREHAAARGGCPMTAQEFYLSELQRKYSRPSRCC